MASAASGPARFVSAQTLAEYRQQLESAKQETLKVQAAAQTAIEMGATTPLLATSRSL